MPYTQLDTKPRNYVSNGMSKIGYFAILLGLIGGTAMLVGILVMAVV